MGGYEPGSVFYEYSRGAVAVQANVDAAERAVSDVFVTPRTRMASAYDPSGRNAYLFGGLFAEPADPIFNFSRFAQPFAVFSSDPPNEVIFADAGPLLAPASPSLVFNASTQTASFTIRNAVSAASAGDLYWTVHPVPAGYTVTPSWGVEPAGAAARTVLVRATGTSDASLLLRFSNEQSWGGAKTIPLDYQP